MYVYSNQIQKKSVAQCLLLSSNSNLRGYQHNSFFLFCIAINRVFLTGHFNKPSGNIDLVIGFILSMLALILTYRLLIVPSFHYLSIYYKRPASAVILLLSLSISYYLSSQIRLVDGKEIINKKEFCELSYHLKTNPLHINEINKNLFLNACINIFSRY